MTMGRLCRELDWSRPRLIKELQNGLRHRTIPEGRVIDWHSPSVLRSLDVAASTVTFGHVKVSEGHIGYVREVVGIDVLPPGAPVDAEVPPSSADAPAASSLLPRTVSNEDLRNCILAIKDERPNDPPDEEDLREEVESRLGLLIGRNRIRKIRNKHAREWVKPRGRPRKPAQF